MRDGWTEATPNIRKLEDLAFLKRGHDLPTQSRVEGHYPVVASNGSVGFHHECIGPVPGVVTGRSGTIGKVMYLESGYWPLNTTLYVTDFKGNNEKFVALTLETMHLGNFAGGTTVPSLDRKVFRGELVYVPSVLEQKRIVDVVSSVDAYIDALQEQVETARMARNAVMHELLSDVGDDWTDSRLGDISTFVSKRELPKGLALDTQYVGLEHVEPKTTLISTWDNVESVSSSVTPFEPEDTLFGRLRPYLHKVAFADFPGVCSPEILVLRSNAKCKSKFLYLLCSLESTVKKCVDMSAGTRMPRTSTTDLASIEVQLPPLDEQNRIVEIVSSMDDVIQSTEQAVADAKNLRSGLLSDLLSGDHEIPASYDSLLGAA